MQFFIQGSEQNSSIAFEESANRLLDELEREQLKGSNDQSSEEICGPEKSVAKRLFIDSEDDENSTDNSWQSKQRKIIEKEGCLVHKIDKMNQDEQLVLTFDAPRVEQRRRGKTFTTGNIWINYHLLVSFRNFAWFFLASEQAIAIL